MDCQIGFSFPLIGQMFYCQSNIPTKTAIFLASFVIGGSLAYYAWKRPYDIQPINSDSSSNLTLEQQALCLTAVNGAVITFHQHESYDPPSIKLSFSNKNIVDQSALPQASLIQGDEFNPQDPEAYFNLALTLHPPVTVMMPNGGEMTKKELFLKVIEMNQAHDQAYLKLGQLLSELGEHSIQLNSRETVTKKDLYVRAIKHNPNCAEAYFELGRILEKGCEFLISGKRMTKKDLYLQAIENDSNCAGAFYYLSMLLAPNECITFRNNKKMNRDQMVERALQLDPDSHGFIHVESFDASSPRSLETS